MNKALKELFEFQKFAGNSKLSELIKETEARWNSALSDEELDSVNAAGDIFSQNKSAKKDEDF
ncbi:MAG: hypothetical protein PUG48_00445 [Clostridia bacterium]|nr:hypothetical protein [Clostridia bacterium]